MNRRSFLKSSVAAWPAVSALAAWAAPPSGRNPNILIRSAWQTVNIGDIAHTPGLLRLLEKYIPEADVTLWPSKVDQGVDELLLRRFPKLNILRGPDDIAAALKKCDFFLHGSAASFGAERDVRRWVSETGKPFGVYGIGVPNYPAAVENIVISPSTKAKTMEVLNQAQFAFFRDSVSMNRAKELGCHNSIMEYCPDAAFACDLHDDAKADAYLKKVGLETGKFLCCIPRLRISPYWKMKPDVPFHPARHARNEEMKEHDHRPLREAITRIVRETEMTVLVCPEDSSHVELGKEMLVDKLPEDVRRRVVWRDSYWLTDEAVSVYKRMPVCSATRCTRRLCASATAFRQSFVVGPSKRPKAPCGATSVCRNGSLISTWKKKWRACRKRPCKWQRIRQGRRRKPWRLARLWKSDNEKRWRSCARPSD
ncbi:MAG: polysaccharide pyruvyl transferase family protein [Pirellulales bacterium]